VNKTELAISLERTRKTYVGPSEQHPADRFTSVAEGVPVEWNEKTAHDMALAYHGQVRSNVTGVLTVSISRPLS
jgi:hypothetical protein